MLTAPAVEAPVSRPFALFLTLFASAALAEEPPTDATATPAETPAAPTETPATPAETPAAPAETPTDTPAATPAPATDPSLPDVAAKAVRGKCERPSVKTEATTGPGADQSYTGTFTVGADGKVTGTERRLLFANQAWTDASSEDGHHGGDCVNVWNVEGEVIAPTGCKSCDLAIQFDADLDFAASTCPQRLEVDGSHFRSAYDVKKKPDGSVEVYFSNSGKKLGDGYWSGQSFNYLSPHRCVWL